MGDGLLSGAARGRRALWAPLAAALGVVASALVPAPALWDAATHAPVPFARLEQPLGYLVGAPLFGVWDSLSVLTLNQHIAVLCTVVLLYVARRVRAPRSRLSIPGRVGMEGVRALVALLLLLGFYAVGMLVPRPMVGLVLDDPDLLSIDFHSHTLHSHDGWSLFTAARNRDWHQGGGFDIAYVTDHYTWAGVDDALPDNPATVGQGTTLLSGAELRLRRRHTNVLGNRTRYAFALDSTWHHLDPDSIALAFHRGAPAPTMLYTLPGPLDQIVPFTADHPAGVIGVELSDGAPRGLEQTKGERLRILAMADSMDLAVVAGANLHGWGRTATAWSVMRLPGWRALSPLGAGDAIESVLHRERRDAVVVVERRMPYHDGSALKIAATVPWLLWEHGRMLSVRERASWLVWILGVAVFAGLRARRPAPAPSAAA